MRLVLEFGLSEPRMAQDYRFAVVSYFKFLLERHYPEEYRSMYLRPVMKAMTFSAHFPAARMERGGIEVPSKRMFLTISAWDAEFVAKLYNAALAEQGKPYPFPQGQQATLTRCRLEFPGPATGDTVIRFLSPLAVRVHGADGKDQYLDSASEEFSSQLNTSVALMAERLGFSGCKDFTVSLLPVAPRRTVVEHGGLRFVVSFGTFRLRAEQALAEFLYRAGMGSRRSEGFGMFDIVARGEGERH